MVRFGLDIGGWETSPTNEVEGFADHLLAALPGLALHGCSRGRPGGFAERLREGTWIGHVIEHVALELQVLAGSRVTRGKTRRRRGHPGVYDVYYAHLSEAVALAAGRLAIELVDRMSPERLRGVTGLDRLAPAITAAAQEEVPGLAALTALAAREALGPTTQSLVDEARRRGIPVTRVGERGRLRLGWGSGQRMLAASLTGATSHLGVLAAADKRLTKQLLDEAGIPVPRGTVVRDADDAVAFAARLGGPVVTKPLSGNHGRGVSTDLRDAFAVREGFAAASAIGRDVIVEQHLAGRDHRLLVVGGRLVAAAERVPPRVVGDGRRSVAELLDELNADPRRGDGHAQVMTRVVRDRSLTSVLAQEGLTLDDVPPAGRTVVLRDTANLSTGGEAIDRTDEVHPEVRLAAERAARVVGLDVAGIDLLTSDLSRPLAETGGGIVEVNAAPGYRMHLAPSQGRPRDVAGATLDVLYPAGTRSRIPVISVTGTNGKSTTVRMIAHILSEAGAGVVGLTTTSGVYVGGVLVHAGDSSGPKSARTILADPTVDIAVLETARGGLLREGLAYDRADVGIVLNVSADHLGLKGIDTLRDLARVKGIVARRVRRRGTTILNADDQLTRRMAARAGGRVAFFTLSGLDDLDDLLRARVADGLVIATLEPSPRGGIITIHDATGAHPIIESADIPATLDGAAVFNVSNAQAAALAAFARRVPVERIAAALQTFEGSFEQNPGRLNITNAPGFTTIVDYAHNPAALRALGDLVHRMRPRFERVIGVVSTPGDRRDDDILELGRLSAGIFDEVVFRELPDGRGRAVGGVVSLLSDAAEGAGMAPENIVRVMDETEAMETAMRHAGPRDLVVLTVSSVESVWRQVHAFGTERADARV